MGDTKRAARVVLGIPKGQTVCVTVGCLVVGTGVDPVVGAWKGGGGLMWRGHYTVYWLVSIAPHVK